MEVIIIIALIFGIIIFIFECTGALFEKIAPSFHVFFDNIYLILGIVCLFIGICIYVYFRPHPSHKHFYAYKRKKISRQQAIERIANNMYNPKKDGVPSVRKSKSIERRVQALRRRVQAEESFINDLISYIKARSRLGDYE